MIIFYDKQTKEITGIINGRVHDKHVLEKVFIGNPEEIEKYIVPFKPRIENKKIVELLPDVPFANKILAFEENQSEIYQYAVKLNKKGEVIGFDKKHKADKIE